MAHFSQTIQHIGNAVNAMTQNTLFGKFLVGLGVAAVSFVTPIADLLMICFATTLADMIFGIKVAHKLNRKIESQKSWKGTLRKILDEFTIILLAHGIEWSIVDQSGVFVLTGGATAIITLTEMWSILENLNTLDPKGPWRVLGKFLKKKGADYIGVELSNDDETISNTEVGENA